MSAEPAPVASHAPPGPHEIVYAGIGDEAGDPIGVQVAALDRLGWKSIELRSVDGVAVADLDEAAFAQLAATLEAHAMQTVCVASQIGNWSRPITGGFAADVDELETLAARCAVLGTRNVRVMSYRNDGLAEDEWGRRALGRLRELASRAEHAGLILVHENCTGWASVEAARMLDLLDAVASPAFGLLFDTGNGVAYGYDARDLLAEIVEHVVHVHVKDVRGTREAPIYAPPGEGDARIADCLRLLLATGYTGAWSIEPHVALRPHEALPGEPGRPGSARLDGFLACGLALESLVRREVLGAVGQWSAAPGGIARLR
jgi:sugar phosphate isomerase/epimerase